MAKKQRLRKAKSKLRELKSTGQMKKIGGAADEVSSAISALFNSHGQSYQNLSGQAKSIHDQFVSTLNCSSGAYSDKPE